MVCLVDSTISHILNYPPSTLVSSQVNLITLSPSSSPLPLPHLQYSRSSLSHKHLRPLYPTHEHLIICAFMCPHNMNEHVLGSSHITSLVGKQHGSPTKAPTAEQTIGYQDGLLVPKVPILSDILCAHHNSISVPMNLEHVLGKITCKTPAFHTPQIEAPNIAPQLVLIRNHGRK